MDRVLQSYLIHGGLAFHTFGYLHSCVPCKYRMEDYRNKKLLYFKRIMYFKLNIAQKAG